MRVRVGVRVETSGLVERCGDAHIGVDGSGVDGTGVKGGGIRAELAVTDGSDAGCRGVDGCGVEGRGVDGGSKDGGRVRDDEAA